MTQVVGIVAAVFVAAMSLPQLARLLRDRATQGINAATWWLFAATAVSWVGYGWQRNDPAVLVANLVFLLSVSSVIVVVTAVRRDRSFLTTTVAVAALMALGILVTARHMSVGVVAVVAVAVTVTASGPQAVTSWRGRLAGTPSEVSLASLAALITGQLLWLLYGVLRPDLPLVVTNVACALVTATVIVAERGRPAPVPA